MLIRTSITGELTKGQAIMLNILTIVIVGLLLGNVYNMEELPSKFLPMLIIAPLGVIFTRLGFKFGLIIQNIIGKAMVLTGDNNLGGAVNIGLQYLMLKYGLPLMIAFVLGLIGPVIIIGVLFGLVG